MCLHGMRVATRPLWIFMFRKGFRTGVRKGFRKGARTLVRKGVRKAFGTGVRT